MNVRAQGDAPQGASPVRNLRKIDDPGHGWLEVDRTDLLALGIADRVSSCSYQRQGRVYLEEDCDMTLYLEAAALHGWTVTYTNVHQEHTPIRNYPSYRP